MRLCTSQTSVLGWSNPLVRAAGMLAEEILNGRESTGLKEIVVL